MSGDSSWMLEISDRVSPPTAKTTTLLFGTEGFTVVMLASEESAPTSFLSPFSHSSTMKSLCSGTDWGTQLTYLGEISPASLQSLFDVTDQQGGVPVVGIGNVRSSLKRTRRSLIRVTHSDWSYNFVNLGHGKLVTFGHERVVDRSISYLHPALSTFWPYQAWCLELQPSLHLAYAVWLKQWEMKK